MALADILTAIRAEGDAEVAQIEAESRAEREAAAAAARQQAERVRQDAAASLQRKTDREVAAILAGARAEAATALRLGREALYQRVIAEVRARLERTRGSDEYRHLLGTLLQEALDALPEADALHYDGRDDGAIAELLASWRRNGLALRSGPDGWGGVAAAAPDGRSVDNRLEVRLERAEPLLREAFGRRLADVEGRRGGS